MREDRNWENLERYERWGKKKEGRKESRRCRGKGTGRQNIAE